MWGKFLVILPLFVTSFANASMSREEFELVKDAVYKTYEDLKISNLEKLSINPPIPGVDFTWWDVEALRASYVYSEVGGTPVHNLFLMGAYIKQPHMSPDALLLTACHELGHGIGGAPYKRSLDPNERMSSSEGQSDYYAAFTCLAVAMDYLPPLREIKQDALYVELCSQQKRHSMPLCVRMMNAAAAWQRDLNVGLKEGELAANISSRSSHVQESLNSDPWYYPDRQCRLDTIINGILGKERPICWYPIDLRSNSVFEQED